MTGAASRLAYTMPAKGEEMKILKADTAENLGVELNAWISIDTPEKLRS